MATSLVPTCMHCGSLPATEVTLRRQTGRGIRRRQRVSVEGDACPATADGYFERRGHAEVLCVDVGA
jgi:hypothetical protein